MFVLGYCPDLLPHSLISGPDRLPATAHYAVTKEAGMSSITVGIHARSSTPDQTARQLQVLRARGWHTLEYIDEGLSGAPGERPGFDTMIADARARKIAAVVCTGLDRLTRSCTVLASFVEELTDLRIPLVVSS